MRRWGDLGSIHPFKSQTLPRSQYCLPGSSSCSVLCREAAERQNVGGESLAVAQATFLWHVTARETWKHAERSL